ncbi:MAG: hypothetical protein IT424_01035 [Pirellulales bacterium]|nr:hypothetical protein [Pirellulales bacterium]
MNPRLLSHLAVFFALGSCLSCGGGSIGAVSGTATVDGVPIDAGAISLRAEGDAGPPAGGPIEAGQFTIASRKPLPPGTYSVSVQASKKTGRAVKDPQRGEIEEMTPLELADSPQQLELTAANAGNLTLRFTTRRR